MYSFILPIHSSIHPSIHQSIHPPFHSSIIHLFIHPPINPSIYLSIHSFILSIHPNFYISAFRPCTDAHDDPIWSCREHTGWDKNKCKVDSIYTVQSQPTVFTTQPEGGSFPLASDVILTCNTTSLQCYSQDDCPSIYWTLNGRLVEDHSHWFTINETSLTISQFDETKQGKYVCHVNDSSFSLQSHAAEVFLPSKQHV